MRLIEPDAFGEIFDPLRGLRLGYVRGEAGNVGDTMQEKALWQLCQFFRLDVAWLGPVAPGREPWDWSLEDGRWDGMLTTPCDHLLLFGGGNMGLRGPSMRLRRRARRLGLPMTVLPNSWRAPEPLGRRVRCFAREEISRRFRPDARVAPDLALGMEFDQVWAGCRPSGLGVFLRSDYEGRFSGACPRTNRGAPFVGIHKRDVDGYLRLAASFEWIVTDALHFAIAGLMAGREVTLVPGTYHKQRGMYDTWLASLGCRWLDDPSSLEIPP